jgi:uncharacterized protein (UPF0335 family)
MSAEASIGHNGSLSAKQRSEMKNYIERVENLESDKREIAAEIGGIYSSAKTAGYDTKAMKAVVKLRRMDRENREAFEHTVDVYKHALGMLADTPLGQAATQQAATAAQPHTS